MFVLTVDSCKPPEKKEIIQYVFGKLETHLEFAFENGLPQVSRIRRASMEHQANADDTNISPRHVIIDAQRLIVDRFIDYCCDNWLFYCASTSESIW